VAGAFRLLRDLICHCFSAHPPGTMTSMYIGIGTVVLIAVIILIIMLLRRGI
jgi:hypothetical protein